MAETSRPTFRKTPATGIAYWPVPPPKYRTGAKRQITEEWRRRVIDRLQAIGKTAAWVERELGLSTGALHLLLHRNHSSVYVDRICELLGILPPVSEDAEVTELVGLITQLTPENRKIVSVLIRALLDFQARNR